MEDDWNDSKGSLHLTAGAGATFASGDKAGGTKAGDFADAANGMASATASGLPSGNGARSVSCWIKPGPRHNYGGIVGWGFGSGDTNTGFSIAWNHVTNNFQVDGHGNKAPNGHDTNLLTDGSTWYNLVMTYDGTTVRWYLNGEADGTDNFPNHGGALNTDTGGSVKLGNQVWNDNERYEGLLDEVGIWSKALTATEVSQLYNSGNGKTYAG